MDFHTAENKKRSCINELRSLFKLLKKYKDKLSKIKYDIKRVKRDLKQLRQNIKNSKSKKNNIVSLREVRKIYSDINVLTFFLQILENKIVIYSRNIMQIRNEIKKILNSLDILSTYNKIVILKRKK